MSEARSLLDVDRRPQVAKYELHEELGHGGMATVYRAHDRRLDREVAIKVIHRHLRESVEVATRFTSEARAVAKLRHPNIVDVYDVSDENEPERYLVVELVRGTTLRRLVAEQKHLPPEIAAAITIEVADALAHAHEHGVVHRDVKPENVLVDLSPARAPGADGDRPSEVRTRIKITDFGIAKLLDAQGVTSTGQVLGSPAHMSPEQIEGGQVTARSDVFGLGVLLYEALVGTLPFDGKNPAQVLRKVLDGKFTPADRARTTVGSGLGRIAGRALAHEPEQRYASVSEMAADLKRELARTGFADYRREIEAFVCRPREYTEAFAERVVVGLVAAGRKAQNERDVPVAAACFNRALAYRPDSPELLRLVSGLAHAERLRQSVRRGLVGLGIVVVLAAVTYGAIGALRTPRTGEVGERPRPPEGVHSPRIPAKDAEQRVDGAPSVVAVAVPRRAPAAPGRQSARIRSTVPVKRQVQVKISGGATGGSVTVNGVSKAHGDFFELVVGEQYMFTFGPPKEDPDCCGTHQVTAVIGPDEPRFVEGRVPYRDAMVVAEGAPDGSKLNCGMGGNGVAPGGFTVRFGDRAEINASCSVIPPSGSGVDPQSGDFKFLPGRTIDLWQ